MPRFSIPSLRKSEVITAVAYFTFSTFAVTQQPQSSSAAALQSLGTQAIHVVMSREILNSYNPDPKTGHPLSHNGKWVVETRAPKPCPTGTQSCVGVRYEVQESGISCAWAVLLEGDGSTGKLLDQNEDATRYFLPRISAENVAGLVEVRKQPEYPTMAAAAHVSGQVDIQIIVNGDGKVINTGVPAGPTMLRSAALQAVREWTFKPYQIGPHSVPFTTLISFKFVTFGPGSGKVTSTP